jgi:hypothetical protein
MNLINRIKDGFKRIFKSPKIITIIVGILIIATIFGALIFSNASSFLGDELSEPSDNLKKHTLPIQSKFDAGILDPFGLYAAFGANGSWSVGFENGMLKYHSESWSWVIVRSELQDIVNCKWVWKAVEGQEFIIEAWNANANHIGHTAMIIFRNNEVFYSNFPNEIYLMDFDPYADFVTVEMKIDYTIPEITYLKINSHVFNHLLIADEPIGATSGFWQMQIFLIGTATVLVKEMEAWK